MPEKNKKDTRSQKRRPFSISFKGRKSMTKQAFKGECDINNIIAKFERTGELPTNPSNIDPQYGEAPTMDLKEALDTVNELHQEYNSLDPDIKARFNGVDEYAKFLNATSNMTEADWEDYIKQSDETASPGTGETASPKLSVEPAEQSAQS